MFILYNVSMGTWGPLKNLNVNILCLVYFNGYLIIFKMVWLLDCHL